MTITQKTRFSFRKSCFFAIILRKGEKNRVHFAHRKESNCEHYEHPTESEIHKEGKRLIKMLIEKNELNIYKECVECGEKEYMKIPEYNKESLIVKLEHSFNHEIYENTNVLRIADVAYLNADESMVWIIEILNTHKTKEVDRPEPWNEIEAKELLKKMKKGGTEIKCSREYTCAKCYEERYKLLDKLSLKELLKSEYLEWFIKYKLGLYIKSNEIDPDNYNDEKYNVKNKFIVDIFKNFYNGKNVELIIHKGYFYITFSSSIVKNDYGSEIYYGEEYMDICANPNEHYICGCCIDMDYNFIIKYILSNLEKEYEEINYDNTKSVKYYTNLIKERIYLSVKYKDKEKIKKMGGLWDVELKKWYILQTNDKKDQILNKYKIIQMYLKKCNKIFPYG